MSNRCHDKRHTLVSGYDTKNKMFGHLTTLEKRVANGDLKKKVKKG